MEHLSTFKRTRIKAKDYRFIVDGKVNSNYPIGYNYVLGFCDAKLRVQQPIDITVMELTVPNKF